MSSSRSTVPPRAAFALALALVLAGCAGPSAADPAPSAPSTPSTAEAATVTPNDAVELPHLVTITTEVEGPGGRSGLVEIRATVVGERRHVVFDTPLGSMGEHVVTPGNHWFRLPAATAEPLGVPADWIHVPLDELEVAGIDLPPALAEVRAPLPDPATVAVGDLVYGARTVLEVRPADDGAVRLALDDGRTVVVHRSPLPAGTTVDPPSSAIDIRDLEDLVTSR